MELVSVIMSTYKEEEKYLRQAIESVLQQTYENIEFVIVCDNPENMLHIDIIKAYQKEDTRIVFLINEKNMGLTASLNKALKQVTGTYICRMDADDVADVNRIALQRDYLQKQDLDLIGGITQMIDENGEVLYSIKKIPSNPETIKTLLCYNQCIAHPTWFGKREVFTTLEGYRNMPLCEDYDFTLRTILKGYRIGNIQETVLQYRMTANSISRSNLLEQFLYAKYIAKQYKHGKEASVEDAKEYVIRHCSENKAKRYLKANTYFNNMLRNIEKKQYLSFVKNGFVVVFSSLYFLQKVYRFLMVSIRS